MNEVKDSVKSFRPRYLCCHPNMKGTGASVRFELHPAHDNVEGSIYATFAAQKTITSCAEGVRIPATFDWAGQITVRLSINEVAEMLEVFRGYRERLADGKGMFHHSESGDAVIKLEHRLEPSPGYLFSVSKKGADGEVRRVGLVLDMRETIVLTEALSSSMLYMAFGIPKVVPRSARRPNQSISSQGKSKEVA
jgi:hypothetical protein